MLRWCSGSSAGRPLAPFTSPQLSRSAAGAGGSALQCQAVVSRACAHDRDLPIQRGGLKTGRGEARLDQVQEDPSDLRGIGDDCQHLHRGAATAAAQRIDLVHPFWACPARGVSLERGTLPPGSVPRAGRVLRGFRPCYARTASRPCARSRICVRSAEKVPRLARSHPIPHLR
jgi:hypothetical protein